MVAIMKIGVMKSMITEQTAADYISLLELYGLPTKVPGELDRKRIKSYLSTDKKSIRGTISYILPQEGGGVTITEDVSEDEIDMALKDRKSTV